MMEWDDKTNLAGWNGTNWEPLTAGNGEPLTAGDMQEIGRRLKLIEGKFHKRKPKISATLVRKMESDRAAGMSVRKLAQKYHVSTRTIEKYTKSANCVTLALK